ncbi:YdiU family protein [Salipaludibacillus agaradhaerens]|uniref:Protein nucleotidyltransferase YdiU n=2 Tax=Salipaludibacillus agaradhaerens TaxID=76935 RepID=A0A9Q4B0Q7_SALAG|nr:YdiU family protein [Salipaludibacillus agaradhaerens]MCR6114210.1 YdiU family protein [Salipaludibacillus agaradhaerens]
MRNLTISHMSKGDTMGQNIDNTGWQLAHSYAELPTIFYSDIALSPVSSPDLVVLNESLAEDLGLDVNELRKDEGIAVLAGNRTPEGGSPLAQAYAGHQFGHFTMLGDGRAMLIGEQLTPKGHRVDIQLKGSGRTPYSRGGDGRAALGPMLREYLISEAMYALGVPTNRSLSVVKTGETVMRETPLTGAVLTRVASSHLRVGTFEYAAKWGDKQDLQALADYAIARHFPQGQETDHPYHFLLQQVIEQQALLVAKWQSLGFIHGVMNTDNVTISGETIDYGPCAFMNTYDPDTVFSSIDVQGRYAYGNQPYITGWNLARLAEALLPLLADDEDKAVEMAQDAISGFSDSYMSYWLENMRAKLGLFNEEEEDEALIKDLLSLMKTYEMDYTNTFIALIFGECRQLVLPDKPDFKHWYSRWQERLKKQDASDEEVRDLMKKSNPAVIPRNHHVEAALEAAEQQDFSVMNQLLDVLLKPYDHERDQDTYASPPEPSNTPYRTFCGT